MKQGRLITVYDRILENASKYKYSYGCYAWCIGDQICYIGSVSKDNTVPNKLNNLQARIENYFRRRGTRKEGSTNARIMNRVADSARAGEVTFAVLSFEHLNFCGSSVGFDTFTKDWSLVLAVEELLICAYRKQNQCQWNAPRVAYGELLG